MLEEENNDLQEPAMWAEINSRLNLAGALLLIAIALLIIAAKL